jgi:hypothetical protein
MRIRKAIAAAITAMLAPAAGGLVVSDLGRE